MKLHIDVRDNTAEESFAVELKVGNHPNHKTFHFRHESILFVTVEGAYKFASQMQELAWDENKAIAIDKLDDSLFTTMIIKEYGMDYIYQTDFLVRKINISYSLLTDMEIRKAKIGLIMHEI